MAILLRNLISQLSKICKNLDTQNFPIYYANSFKPSCELTLQDFYEHPLIIIRSLMPLESYNLEAILGHNTKKKEKEAVKDWLMSSLLVEDDPSISVLCKDDHYEEFLHNKLQPFTLKVKIVKPDLGFFLMKIQSCFS